ncbi:MAG: AMP-binding protein, partial [Actinomycetes bacterium]
MEFNFAQVFWTVARAVPESECIVTPTRRLDYAAVADAAARLANVLIDRGFGTVVDRSTLPNHASGQDHVALYLHNSPEYLIGMLGSYAARTAPFNVNYRYVAEELEYVLADANAAVVIVHSAFAPTLAEVRDRLPSLRLILQVPDDSGNELLPGAEWFDEALDAASSDLDPALEAAWSPDDLYILYT